MSIYISPEKNYPRHDGDIKLVHPDWKEGDVLPNGWIQVIPTEMPSYQEGKVIYEIAPIETDGTYFQTWAVRDLTAEEIEARKIAEVRRKVANGETITSNEAALLVG